LVNTVPQFRTLPDITNILDPEHYVGPG